MLLMIATSFSVFAGDTKISIYTPNAPEPIGTYSQGIQFGNLFFISGQIPVNPKTGELVQGSFKDQIRQVFTNISEITKAGGGNINDILKLTIYLTDLSNFSEVNAVMTEFFDKPYPARAVIEIKALPKNATVEVESIMGLRNR
jgi:reactive intermediate/imine deaminase